MRQEHVLDLVGLIYDAALEPARWPVALRRVADLAEGVVAPVYCVEPSTNRIVHDLSSGFPGREAYFAHYVRIDPRNAFGARQPAGSRITDYAFIGEREIARSEFYQDYLIPNGMGHIGARMLKNDAHGVAGIAVQRPRDRGPFQPEELRFLDYLAPHLLRALKVQTRLAEAEAQRAADAGVLDRLPFGVGLLDERGRVVLLNRMALALIAPGDGLTVVRGELRAHRPAESDHLRRLIAGAIATARGGWERRRASPLVSC
jgi:hypothetical protein